VGGRRFTALEFEVGGRRFTALEFEVGGRRFMTAAGDVVHIHSHSQKQITVRLFPVTGLKIIG
jgi:hypothetical protein